MALGTDTMTRGRAALIGMMLERRADRHGITVSDLAAALGLRPPLVAALLAGAGADGQVARMGRTPAGATLYTVRPGRLPLAAETGDELRAVADALRAARRGRLRPA